MAAVLPDLTTRPGEDQAAAGGGGAGRVPVRGHRELRREVVAEGHGQGGSPGDPRPGGAHTVGGFGLDVGGHRERPQVDDRGARRRSRKGAPADQGGGDRVLGEPAPVRVARGSGP